MQLHSFFKGRNSFFHRQRINYLMVLLIISFYIVFTSCKKGGELSKENAETCIKALDSDLTRLSDGISEDVSFKALQFLFHDSTSPLYMSSMLPEFWIPILKTPGLANSLGSYQWNADSNSFLGPLPSGDMNIIFPSENSEKNDLNFSLSGLAVHQIPGSTTIPLTFKGIMKQDNSSILEANYESHISDYWPDRIDFDFAGKGFKGDFNLKRQRDGDAGRVRTEISFNVKGKKIIHGKILTEIGYNDRQIFTKTIEPDLRIFDVIIRGKLDYTKVNPTSKDYINEFNSNCNISFIDAGTDARIGTLSLGKEKDKDTLEWQIRLCDGSKVSLGESILVFKKLINFKLPNRKR